MIKAQPRRAAEKCTTNTTPINTIQTKTQPHKYPKSIFQPKLATPLVDTIAEQANISPLPAHSQTIFTVHSPLTQPFLQNGRQKNTLFHSALMVEVQYQTSPWPTIVHMASFQAPPKRATPLLVGSPLQMAAHKSPIKQRWKSPQHKPFMHTGRQSNTLFHSALMVEVQYQTSPWPTIVHMARFQAPPKRATHSKDGLRKLH